MPQSLKQRWTAGAPCYGAWSTIDNPVPVELMGRSGFDFVTIDLQHGFASQHSLPHLLNALHSTPALACVRVAWNAPEQIMRALDLGADGVIVPMVSTAREAASAASACRYAPAGQRSWGPILANASHRPVEPDDGDARATCIVMIETASGLEEVDAIAATPGVDALYIGPNDLALSLGLGRVGYRESPALLEAMQAIVAVGRQNGIAVGVDCTTSADARFWHESGAAFTMSASDALLLRAAADAAGASLSR
ncbi:HpcH/HpaI aldolase family protein [Glaciibacter sp. 2TAF33]|uniref:HpcH/HpaI aldolase family protein n=1 Tax=Glaciibacter sp. 2TAF33 TaxID=3233015 RepID=UPI003F92320C